MSVMGPKHHTANNSGIAIGQFGFNGKVLSPDQVIEQYKRKGLCPTCGKVRTHAKKYGLHMEPLNKDGVSFGGYCLKCNSLDEVLQMPDVQARIAESKKKKREKLFGMNAYYMNSSTPTSAAKNRTHDQNVPDESITEGLNTIKTVTTEDFSDRESAAAASGPALRDLQSILDEMAKCHDDPGIQESACTELAKRSNYETSEELVFAVDAIVSAMGKHPSNANVQKKGCHAFFRFTNAGGARATEQVQDSPMESSVNADLCIALVVRGGIYAVVSAMLAHESERSVQREGMRVLRNILKANPKNRKLRVLNEREIGAVVNAMEMHAASASVQRIAADLLRVAAGSETNIGVLREQPRLMGALQEAATNFPRDCAHAASYVMRMMDSRSQ